MESDVRHNEPECRFELGSDGDLAVAEYIDRGDALIFTHTFVPPSLRGQGIAARLVEAGLDFARSRHRAVVPRCSYVATFLKRRPEYADLSAE